jgi:ribose transport system permease protein
VDLAWGAWTGRYVFAAGNPEAAPLSGVRVSRLLWISFAMGGLAVGLAGAIGAAQSVGAQASEDFSIVFAVIAAVGCGWHLDCRR